MNRHDDDFQRLPDAAGDQESHGGAAGDDQGEHEGDNHHRLVSLTHRRLFERGGFGGGKFSNLVDCLQYGIDQQGVAAVVQGGGFGAASAERQRQGFVAGGPPVGQGLVDQGQIRGIAQVALVHRRHIFVDSGRGRGQLLLQLAGLGRIGIAHQAAPDHPGGEDIRFHFEYGGRYGERVPEEVGADPGQQGNAAHPQEAQYQGAQKHQRESKGQPGDDFRSIQHRLVLIQVGSE